MSETFNLIREAWLPVRRSDGSRHRIAPCQITDTIADNPVIAVDWPRPDFDGATLEFLIGLLATAAAPKDIDAWLDWWEAPPSPDHLRSSFDSIAFAFDLDGGGPRFMQELGGLDAPSDREIAALLIDHPGEQSVERHADHFVKHGGVQVLSRACAAIALYAAQTYSPAGGSGFLTSMRGGGPLTTLAIGQRRGRNTSLWDCLWPNVPQADWSDWRHDRSKVFPWLAPTRSSRDHPVTTLEHGHVLQAFWGMPRRIRLVLEPARGRSCDLGGPPDQTLVVGWQTKQHGIKYEGWTHPLSPYSRVKTSELPNPMKGSTGRITYRHWLGLVQDDPEKGRHPAFCVRYFVKPDGRASICTNLDGTRLIAFGYDVDKMKARCWYQSQMPVPKVSTADRQCLDDRVAQIVRGADLAAGFTRSAVTRGLFARPADAPGDFSAIVDRFWRDTESEFFALLGVLAANPDSPAHREAWQSVLRRTGLAIFDDLVPSDGIEAGDWRRVIEARRALNWNLSGAILLSKLGLAVAPTGGKSRKRKAEVTV